MSTQTTPAFHIGYLEEAVTRNEEMAEMYSEYSEWYNYHVGYARWAAVVANTLRNNFEDIYSPVDSAELNRVANQHRWIRPTL